MYILNISLKYVFSIILFNFNIGRLQMVGREDEREEEDCLIFI